MPITIDGSGTVTGISAGGLPDGVITTDDIAANAVTYAKIGTTEQGQLCKAWVNFDGTGAPSIRGQYNVSSITDNGTGDYTVNFTTAMPNSNYAAVGVSGNLDSSTGAPGTATTFRATGSVRIYTSNPDTVTLIDRADISVAVFR